MIAKRLNNRKDKSLSNRVYCTIDGVLTPVVYKALETNYTTYTDLYVTNEQRIEQQKSLTKSISISRNFEEIENNAVVDVKPVCVFDFHSNVQSTNNKVELWRSSFGLLNLNQSTTANQPILGEEGRGNNTFSPIRFTIPNSFMSLSSSATLSGDFTMFFYVTIIGHPVNKYMRFLGKSDDNDMFFSAGDVANKSYILSFSSSSNVTFPSSTFYYEPTGNPLLITVRRKGDVLEIRENGVSIGSQTCPTTDFTFDQFGKTGNINDLFFNGNLFHFSAYDGYLDNSLETVENAILKSVTQAKAIK